MRMPSLASSARFSALLSSAAFSAALLAPAATAAAEYRITFNPSQPLVARVEVVAPKNLKRIKSISPLTTRSSAQGTRELVSQVRCDGALLKRGPLGWTLPTQGCVRLSWSIAFATLSGQGVDASAQENLFHPGSRSWLLSEPASLLRWPESGGHIVVRGAGPVRGGLAVNQGEQDQTTDTVYLASLDDAPDYLLIGPAPVNRVVLKPDGASGQPDAAAPVSTYARLTAGAVDALSALERAHAQAMAHFAQLARATLSPTLVVWLPIDARQGGVGAISGGHTVLANIATEKAIAAPSGLPYTLAAVLQTQFAQVAQSVAPASSSSRLPLWLSLSLSEYYVRKALAVSGLDAVVLARIEQSYLAADAQPTATLMALQGRAEFMDAEANRLLMTEGSTFWLALDRAIQAGSDGKRSLDDELPEILRTEFGSTRLPLALTERLRQAVGTEVFNALQTRYLGTTP